MAISIVFCNIIDSKRLFPALEIRYSVILIFDLQRY